MGQACAKSDNRSEADDMHPRTQKDPNKGSIATNGSISEQTGLYGSTSTYQSTGETGGELFYDGRSASGGANQIAIEDFTLLKVVGRGSFGKVYMARKKDSGQIYAVKTLKKDFIIKTNQVNNTKIERDIMQQITHPFVVKLHYAFQSAQSLYFVTDFLNGGELFFHLCQDVRFTEERACFYAAEMTLALEHLHNNNIIYRDLKPENVLLDSQGHLKLTDFGLSKIKQPEDGEMTNTFCGTPEYLAPEIIKANGHSYAVDWWSLGMLTYEMISGINPFKQAAMQGNKSRHEILRQITQEDVKILPGFSPNAASLLSGLLQRDPDNRLTAEQVKGHPFFSAINWDELAARKTVPPYVPSLKSETDIQNIDTDFTNEVPRETIQESNGLATVQIEQFTYGGENLFDR